MARINRQFAASSAAALALGLVMGAALFRDGGPASNPAQAQAHTGGLISAAEQRKQMIAQMQRLENRMERIEAQLKSGLTVKVTEMPPVRLRDQPRENEREETNDRRSAQVEQVERGN
ncbi:MAG: hypothetical protein JJU33_11450 [Phycisphaerales bacterium]|nr:hypothetical protein [Phycisphaerales bacterium]